jgi:hypothetical protein
MLLLPVNTTTPLQNSHTIGRVAGQGYFFILNFGQTSLAVISSQLFSYIVASVRN